MFVNMVVQVYKLFVQNFQTVKIKKKPTCDYQAVVVMYDTYK